MIIYKITNLITSKIYIGQDSKNRSGYFGSGIYIKRAIKKYGLINFSKEILQHCKTIDELNLAEIFWINKLNSIDPNVGYNIAKGGNSVMHGRTHSINSKNLMSSSQIKFYETHNGPFTGKNHTFETKATLVKSRKKFLNSREGLIYKENLSKIRTGKPGSTKPRTARQRKNISNGKIEFYKTSEGQKMIETARLSRIEFYKTTKGKTCIKNSSIAKCKNLYKIDQLTINGEFVKTWENILEIKRTNSNFSTSNISNCIHNKYKQAYGSIWKKSKNN